MKRALIACFISLLCLGLNAQDQVTRLRGELLYGFIIAHAADLQPVSDYNPYGITLSWQRMATGQRQWEACNCFHYLGVMVSYHNFRNSEVLGSAFTLAGTFEPVLWRYGHMALSLHTGVGASWLTRVHHPEDNPTNNFFSSPLSFLLLVAPSLQYRISDHWGAGATFTYNHISNGGQRQPNRGMNFPQASVTINRYLETAELPLYTGREPESRIHLHAGMGFTTHKTGEGDNREPVFSVDAGGYIPVTAINGLGAGAEFTLDYSLPAAENSNYGQQTLAPYISHHFLMGRFNFAQRMGYYIITPADSQEHTFYQRYLLMFNLFSDFSIGSSLKAHRHRASNLDFRISYRF